MSVKKVIDFVEFVLKGVVENPECLKVVADIQSCEDSPETEGDLETPVLKKAVLFIYTNDSDCGRIIGKQGKMIRAVRTLVTAVAGKDGYRWVVSVVKVEDQNVVCGEGDSGSSVSV